MWLFKNWYFLYANVTKAEAAIEPAIAALGRRYRAQHLFPGLKHVADFALLDDRLIIEVDGKSHETEAQIRKDLTHTLALMKLGWRVFRCKNDEAISDPKGTVARALAAGPTHFPTQAELEAALQKLPAPVVRESKRRARKPGRPPANPPKKAKSVKGVRVAR